MKKILFVFGTRPEAIKFAPLIKELEKHDCFNVRIAVTAQHREMLDQVLAFFDITPHHDLNLMKPGQDLFDVTAGALTGLRDVIGLEKPDLVFVQGDTTTVFAGALASFYLRIPVAHLEAGLRSHNRYSPFPEELNRTMAGNLSTWHFAPTEKAARDLAAEGITENVHTVGNTVIDALFLALDLIDTDLSLKQEIEKDFLPLIRKESRVVLITGHRRESFGGPFISICKAVSDLAQRYPDVDFVYPVHLNPNVQKPVFELLAKVSNVHLLDPLPYPRLVWLMNRSYLVITDSGGIQEEAPALGKPVLVMRDVTERTEGVEAGTARLVGTDRQIILNTACLLLNNEEEYGEMAKAVNPYGDGKTSARIAEILMEER